LTSTLLTQSRDLLETYSENRSISICDAHIISARP
jgi:hypothetical protein